MNLLVDHIICTCSFVEIVNLFHYLYSLFFFSSCCLKFNIFIGLDNFFSCLLINRLIKLMFL